MDASRFGLGDAREDDFQHTLIEFRGDSLVIDFIAEDERAQEVSEGVLLMNQSGVRGQDVVHATEECQLVVLNLQLERFERDSRQIGLQDESVGSFKNVDWRCEDSGSTGISGLLP